MKAKVFSKYFILSVIVLLSAYLLLLLKQYLIAIVFSLICAYFFGPLYDFFKKYLKKEWISSFLVIVVVFLCVIIPSVYILYSFIDQANSYINSINPYEAGEQLTSIKEFIECNFNIELVNLDRNEIISAVSEKLFPYIQSILPKLISTLSNILIQVFIFAFILYYLLINKEKVKKSILKYLPFTHKHSTLLLDETASTTKALVLGQGLIAIIQGTAGAIGFLIFGVEHIFLWWFVMTILSFIPFVGAAMVWIPASLLLIFNGNLFAGIGLALWGLILVSNIDNLVRPYLISTMSDIHPVVVLLGVFIGIKEFSILGIIIGPLLLSTVLILAKLFEKEYIIK